MPGGNPAVKLAVTVDADVHAKVLDAAAAEGTGISAWITAAARRALLIRDGLAAVAEWPCPTIRIDEIRFRAIERAVFCDGSADRI